jgi:GNAT superfamily N-acetyltransferase
MKIKNLNADNLEDIVKPCICEEWCKKLSENTDIKIERVRKFLFEGARLKIDWITKRLKSGYKAKILYEQDKPIGFIDYLPIETQIEIAGQDVTLINCISIIFGYRGKGYGKLLLKEAEIDAEKFSKGIVVVAHEHPKWMPISFFSNMGYRVVDERDGKIRRILMFKAFKTVKTPKFGSPKYQYKAESGKLLVEIFWSGACPHNLLSIELLKCEIKKLRKKIFIKEIFTNDLSKDVIQKYGYDYGVYINGKPNFWLLGASRDEIRHEISKYKI